MRRNNGFSLVEMMIVVSIMALLLVLLVAGVSKTLYAADLAKCSTQLRAIASGSQMYAMDQRRHYPIAPGGRHPIAHFLGSDRPTTRQYDLRPVVERYIDVRLWVCPLSPRISLAAEDTGEGSAYSSYIFWMAWQYRPRDLPVERGMFRLGDRWTWDGRPFNLLVVDTDNNVSNDNAFSSHPDHEGVMSSYRYQNQPADFDPQPFTQSGWQAEDVRRGRIDFNSAHDDGSIRRISGVEPVDSRMQRVPLIATVRDVEPVWLNVPMN